MWKNIVKNVNKVYVKNGLQNMFYWIESSVSAEGNDRRGIDFSFFIVENDIWERSLA